MIVEARPAQGLALARVRDRRFCELLESRIAEDPFVGEGVVIPEIAGIVPGRTGNRPSVLVSEAA